MPESRALSQWEIDALLNQIPESSSPPRDPGHTRELPQELRSMGGSDRGRDSARVIKGYDFRRPDKFSREQWHTLQGMHETFARLVGAAFSSRLRTLVSVRLSSIEQGLYEEWQSQVPSQTICYVLSMHPLSGNLVVEFSMEVAIESVERLLGGNGQLLDRNRELGEIELSLLRTFARSVLSSIEETWSAFTPVRPELQDLGLDAGLIQIASPNDVVISAFFEVNIGSRLGALSICIPYTVLEPVASHLSTQLLHGSGATARPDARARRVLEALLDRAPLDLSVELGSAELPVHAVLEMATGDTLVLDARADRALPLLVGGRRRFLCRPGVVGNKVSVRVTDVVEEPVYDFETGDDNVSTFPRAQAARAGDPPALPGMRKEAASA